VVRRDVLPGEVAQREQLTEWESVLAASGLPVAGLDRQRPKARLAFAAPLSASIPGEAELVDVWLVERLPRWRVREALAGGLPDGYALVDLYDVWPGEPPLPGRVAASVYRATLPASVDASRLAAAAATLIAAESLPRERRKGDGSVRYDLRPFLVSLEVQPAADGRCLVRMTLRHDPAKGVGRPDEALAALAEALGGPPLVAAELVRETLVLAEPQAAETPAPRVPRRPAARSSPDSRSGRPAANGL
jgi:hypothetical protein